MKQKPTGRTSSSEKIIRDIKRNTRKQYSAEEKIRIVLDGVRGRSQHGGAVPTGGHRSEPVLQMVQGLYAGRQEAPGRGHCSPGQHE